MAESNQVTLNKATITGGEVVAADTIAAKQYQLIKLILGAAGVNDGPVSAANPLPTVDADAAAALADILAKLSADPATSAGVAAAANVIIAQLAVNLAGTQPVSAAALPLPAGAASETTLALIEAVLSAWTFNSGAAVVTVVNPLGGLLGSGNFEVVDDQVLSAIAAGFTFSGLDGSAAYIYKLEGVLIGDTSAGSGPVPALILNGDTGNNYERQTHAFTTVLTSSNAAAQAQFDMQTAVLSAGELAIFTIMVYANTGQLHVLCADIANNTGTGGARHLTTGQWNAGTSQEVTSILLSADVGGAGRYAAGSRCQLSRLALAP
jgi:hypothetical protein